jgi:hypothetical protein
MCIIPGLLTMTMYVNRPIVVLLDVCNWKLEIKIEKLSKCGFTISLLQ